MKIIKSMWINDRTSITGKHYTVNEIEKAGELVEGEYPKIMVGGGGRKKLRLAAKYADIVGILPRWKGSWGQVIRDHTTENIKRKIDRVKKMAVEFGRDPDDIEFQLVFFWTEITDNPDPVYAGQNSWSGVSFEELKSSGVVLVGSVGMIRDRLTALREETGVNYFVFTLRRENQFEEYSKQIIRPLLKNP